MAWREVRTRRFQEALKSLGVTSALIVIDGPDEILERSARNVPGVQVMQCQGLNVHDILRYEHLVFLRSTWRKWKGILKHERTASDHQETPDYGEEHEAERGRNQIAFVVDPGANKVQIRQAVEKLFKVKVKSVRTMNLVGKRKRMGKFWGWKSDWKKAIVTLKEGERIEFFEGA